MSNMIKKLLILGILIVMLPIVFAASKDLTCPTGMFATGIDGLSGANGFSELALTCGSLSTSAKGSSGVAGDASHGSAVSFSCPAGEFLSTLKIRKSGSKILFIQPTCENHFASPSIGHYLSSVSGTDSFLRCNTKNQPTYRFTGVVVEINGGFITDLSLGVNSCNNPPSTSTPPVATSPPLSQPAQLSPGNFKINCPSGSLVSGFKIDYGNTINGITAICSGNQLSNLAGTTSTDSEQKNCNQPLTRISYVKGQSGVYSVGGQCESNIIQINTNYFSQLTSSANQVIRECQLGIESLFVDFDGSKITDLNVGCKVSVGPPAPLITPIGVVGQTGFCKYKRIAIVGASNTMPEGPNRKRKAYGEYIKDKCQGSDVEIFAESGKGPHKLKNLFLTQIKNFKPDLLILNPTGTGVQTLSNHVKNTRTFVNELKKLNSAVMVTTISPRKDYDFIGAKWTQAIQDNIISYNENLRDHKLNYKIKSSQHIQIDQVIDIYPVLDKNSDDYCDYCIKDKGHWNAEGHKRVADAIIPYIQGAQTAGQVGPAVSSGASSPGVSPPVSSAVVSSTSNSRQIDEVWKIISPYVSHNGEVFHGNVWRPFSEVYSLPAPPPPPASTPQVSATGITGAATAGNNFVCQNFDITSMKNSKFSRCYDHIDIFKKEIKNQLGLKEGTADFDNFLLLAISKSFAESGCKTTIKGGIMQVDSTRKLWPNNIPSAADQIKKGISVWKSWLSKVSSANEKEKIPLALLGYNRGGASTKALKYRNAGKTLWEAMFQGCKEVMNHKINGKDCKGVHGRCRYDSSGNDKCDYPGYGARYHTRILQRFNQACESVGGTYQIDPDMITVTEKYLGKLAGSTRKRKSNEFVVLHDGGFPGHCDKKVEEVIKFWSKKNPKISSHYYICTGGTVHHILDESTPGVHAGCSGSKSSECAINDVNPRSIGIDLQYTGKKNAPYTKEQIVSLNFLLKDLKKRGKVDALDDSHIVAHFEVKKKHHNDPRDGFPWTQIVGITYDHRQLNGPKEVPGKVTSPRVGLIRNAITENPNYVAGPSVGPSTVSANVKEIHGCKYTTTNTDTQAVGNSIKGSLTNGIKSESGSFWYGVPNRNRYSNLLGKKVTAVYGTIELVNALELASCYVAEKTGSKKIQVNDLSNEGGGIVWKNKKAAALTDKKFYKLTPSSKKYGYSGHTTHQSGVDADIGYYVVLKGKLTNRLTTAGCSSSTCKKRANPSFTHKKALEANWLLLRTMTELYPMHDFLFDRYLIYELHKYVCTNHKNDPVRKDFFPTCSLPKIQDIKKSYGKGWGKKAASKRSLIRHVGGHANHYHIVIRCPQDDNKCKPQGGSARANRGINFDAIKPQGVV